MEYVCDGPNDVTWFRLMTEAEAVAESEEMRHAVEKHYRRERERAGESFRPLSNVFIEQDIGKEAHIQRSMPMFLTLRDMDGNGLATAMLPPGDDRWDSVCGFTRQRQKATLITHSKCSPVHGTHCVR